MKPGAENTRGAQAAFRNSPIRQQPLHVADGVGAAAVVPVGVVVHLRDVVVEQEAVEAVPRAAAA